MSSVPTLGAPSRPEASPPADARRPHATALLEIDDRGTGRIGRSDLENYLERTWEVMRRWIRDHQHADGT